MQETVTIARRFCGPPQSGNGGYSCGVAARFVDGPAQVSLRAPPPLDTPLEVERDGEAVRLTHGASLIAEARPARPQAVPPPAPSLAQAQAGARNYRGHRGHIFPTCFVCGPQRAEGDGLRIFSGRFEQQGALAAAPWTASADLADADGRVAAEHIWAALDCPSYWALARAGSLLAVLGRLTAEIVARPAPGETLITAAWQTGQDGRKHYSASAIYDGAGKPIAWADAVWVELNRAPASP